MIRLEPKLPAEVRNYRHDWTKFLGDTDTIVSQTTTSEGVAISNDAPDPDNKTVSWKVSGGTLGTIATITQTITTDAGLTETETFALPISLDEPVSLDQAKDYLRVKTTSEDPKIFAMIPQARRWVEDYTGLALIQRQFQELRRPRNGFIELFKGPLISVDSVTYGGEQTYTPRSWAPSTRLAAALGGTWPALIDHDLFEITYTAGLAPEDIDDRLIGAVLALMEGEYSEGYAYPDRSIAAAEQCCGFLRTQIV